MTDWRIQLSERSRHTHAAITDVDLVVKDFALINYLVEVERLETLIADSSLKPVILETSRGPRGVLSMAPLENYKIGYHRLLPFLSMSYPELNYRIYVIGEDGEPGVYFPKMLSGSRADYLTRFAFQMPWYEANFQKHCNYDELSHRYQDFSYKINTHDDEVEIALEDTGTPVHDFPAFESFEHMKLVITHPEQAYFKRTGDKKVALVHAYHKEITMTQGHVRKISSRFLEDNGLLNSEEIAQPHSVFICRSVPYVVTTPPTLV